MPNITISITDTEQKALETVMVDISEWTDMQLPTGQGLPK